MNNNWTAENQADLEAMEGLLTATRNRIEYLKAAKRLQCAPEQLAVRMEAHRKIQDKIIERLITSARKAGATVKPGVSVPGCYVGKAVYRWDFTYTLNGNRSLVLHFERGDDYEFFDMPLAFCWKAYQKEGKARRVLEDYIDYTDCENATDLTRNVKEILKRLSFDCGITLQIKK